MELNLNTIRSLDANKTYYIANSTRAALTAPSAAPASAPGAPSGETLAGNFVSV